MKLINLLNVLDGDTRIIVQHKQNTIFNGFASDIVPVHFSFQALESEIKSVWYSTRLERIVIEC